jgi:hypothetical protein
VNSKTLNPLSEAHVNDGARSSGPKPGKAAKITGNILVWFVGLVLLGSGIAKLSHLPPVVAEMTFLNLGGWKLTLVGSLEIFTGLLFLTPPLRSLGLVVISAYLGAAACAHLQTDQYGGIGPAVFLIGCCWIGVALRHPQVLWSFRASSFVEDSPGSSHVGAFSGSKSSDLTHSSQI